MVFAGSSPRGQVSTPGQFT